MNGKKVNRLYGNYYHLGELEKGIYEIKVTLNANNHGVLFAGRKEIAYRTVIKVE
ncbi:hypothetical protein [Mesobacillus subterraneus]|uniref:hypothetical protein n=1 Tax=Mesobacillus subterraneus TaxID=285983 RepID=UPI00147341C0|nr:hypothetical protein [Mesobacillus subterraneus]